MNDINSYICQECKNPSENEGSACKGACSQEMHFGGNLSNTNGLITCNCCDSCRLECHNSFMKSLEDGEQD